MLTHRDLKMSVRFTQGVLRIASRNGNRQNKQIIVFRRWKMEQRFVKKMPQTKSLEKHENFENISSF